VNPIPPTSIPGIGPSNRADSMNSGSLKVNRPSEFWVKIDSRHVIIKAIVKAAVAKDFSKRVFLG